MMHGQDRAFMTGINASDLARGEASLFIECGNIGHWSLGGAVCYGFGTLMKGPTLLESSHRQEFGDSIFRPDPEDIHRESIYARYWHKQHMKGPYMMTEISHGSNSGTSVKVGAGFVMNVWKSINIYTEYTIGISGSDKNTEKLSTGICLTFGKHQ